jgi:hypothetical protein
VIYRIWCVSSSEIRFASADKKLPLQDLSAYVRMDQQFPHPIGCGTDSNVYRALYELPDHRTLQVNSMKVGFLMSLGSCKL